MKTINQVYKNKELILRDLFSFKMKQLGILENITNLFHEYSYLISKFGPSNELISEIFKFDKLGLRYDLTMPLLENIDTFDKFTRFEIGTVFRNSPNTSIRFKEFIQADIDSTEKEFKDILKIITDFLNELNINYIIELNHTSITNQYFLDFPDEIKKEYLNIIDKLKKKDLHELKQEIILKNLDLNIFLKFINSKFEPPNTIEEISNNLKNEKNQIIFNACLVRGLNFYNGITCEIFLKNNKNAICAGGEYTYKDKNFTGLSIGISRLAKLINLKKKMLIVVKYNIPWINTLIHPYTEIIYYDTIKRSFKFYIKDISKRYQYLIVLGEKELKNNTIELKNFENSEILQYNLLDFLKEYNNILKK